MFGEHQIDNASTAIATVLSLKNKKIKTNIINNGLLKVNWPARMQKLDKGKLSKFTGNSFEIWLDGGHNIEASSIIQKTFKIWDRENIFVILGMSIGKDPIGFLNGIIKNITGLFLLPIPNHQYIQPYEIKQKVESTFNMKFTTDCCLDIREALTTIQRKFSSGKIFICGSLYLAGEILKEDGFKVI